MKQRGHNVHVHTALLDIVEKRWNWFFEYYLGELLEYFGFKEHDPNTWARNKSLVKDPYSFLEMTVRSVSDIYDLGKWGSAKLLLWAKTDIASDTRNLWMPSCHRSIFEPYLSISVCPNWLLLDLSMGILKSALFNCNKSYARSFKRSSRVGSERLKGSICVVQSNQLTPYCFT